MHCWGNSGSTQVFQLVAPYAASLESILPFIRGTILTLLGAAGGRGAQLVMAMAMAHGLCRFGGAIFLAFLLMT